MADEPQNTQDEGAAQVESPAAENERDLLDEIQQRKIQEHQSAGEPASQAHVTEAPTEPSPSTSGPQDALAGSPPPPQATGGVPASRQPEESAVASRPGPEDALDPRAENRGDYSEPGRTDDAIHMHHEAVPDDELQPGGPRSRPVAQNQVAEEYLSGLEQTAAQAQGEDPAAEAARERAAAEQAGQPGEDRPATAEEQPAAGEQA